ncbi:sulfurtransferase [Cryobacterium psychrophilum]|uniref:Sulfurtransferase n=1 Tax=Cryobacterium psychrophilum TaxID=41988 RepID=A0A4Y8KNQ6_9MICO|nr:sulfurtransferase [Cryobacterium psychrophilum]TDW31071.1 thiosulfate/3-mercaptopyruvate sulfurtransferase [Cryobacterium psychrophilum]TFD78628.1 sulfurtransferase [Cryobacterium psychrophilum]
MSLLITATELAHELAESDTVRILDVRWRLDRPDGHPEYLQGHIPGAVYVDLDTELASHGAATDGRHPLPSRQAIEDAARSWGINPGDSVVVYDDLNNFSAARAWWLLTYAGLGTVRLLDGSLRAWTAAGFELAAGEESIIPGTVELGWDQLPVTTLAEIAHLTETGVVLDARAPERYRGDVEPIDPRAGHIPGALNAPATANIDGDGRFLPGAQLREKYLAVGVQPQSPIAVYCGSGIVAAHDVVALMLAGFAPMLYPGSFSQWSNHPDLPVALGPTANGRVEHSRGEAPA